MLRKMRNKLRMRKIKLINSNHTKLNIFKKVKYNYIRLKKNIKKIKINQMIILVNNNYLKLKLILNVRFVIKNLSMKLRLNIMLEPNMVRMIGIVVLIVINVRLIDRMF